MSAEDNFAMHIKAIGLPEPKREYRFHDKRRWRFDFAWPELLIAVEIEGVTRFGNNANGTMRLSRHQTHKGYEADCEKYNAAIFLGWRVFRFTQGQVRRGEAIDLVERFLK